MFQQIIKARLMTYTTFIGLVLSGCGTGLPQNSSLNTGTNTNTNTNPYGNGYTGGTSIPAPCCQLGTEPCCNQNTTSTYSCSLTMTGGSPTVSTPVSNVTYALVISPVPTSAPTPSISSTPSGAFNTVSLTSNSSYNFTLTGNFSQAGNITLNANMTIGSQAVTCSTVTTATQPTANVSTATVYVSYRTNPPDDYYGTSPSAPAGYTMGGPIFKVYTQAPPSSFCTPSPLWECMVPFTSGSGQTYSVSFLTQVPNCLYNGYQYQTVGQVGYTCSTQVSGTTPLYRLYDPYWGRYFTTASGPNSGNPNNDVQSMQAQGWQYQGVVGFAPLQ